MAISSSENDFHSPVIEDKVNNSKDKSITCPLEIKDKGNNSQAENLFSPHEIAKEKNSNAQNISCSLATEEKQF